MWAPFEDSHFARLVGARIGGFDRARIVFGERQPQRWHARLALDGEKMEQLSRCHELILVAEFVLQRLGFDLRIAGHDAVHERVVERVGGLDPSDEVGLQIPLLCMAQHNAAQFLAAVIDQLAGDHLPTVFSASCKRFPPLVKQAGQFGRKGRGRRVVIDGPRRIGDARLGGVGNDDADGGVTCKREHARPVFTSGNLVSYAADNA